MLPDGSERRIAGSSRSWRMDLQVMGCCCHGNLAGVRFPVFCQIVAKIIQEGDVKKPTNETPFYVGQLTESDIRSGQGWGHTETQRFLSHVRVNEP